MSPAARSRTGARILLRTLTRNARRLSAGTALISMHQVCEALTPILIGVIVDRAVATGSVAALGWWIAALAGLFVVLTVVYRFGARQLMLAIAEEAHRLRMEVCAKVLQPRGVCTDLRVGDLLTISTSDADNTSYLLDYFPRIFGSLVATAVSAVALFLISVPLGLAVLVGTPVVLIALQVSSPLITRRVADQQELASRATSLATDLVSGLRALRGIGAQEAAARRYEQVSQQSLRAALRATRTQGGYLAGSTAASTLLAGGIAILAGWFALTGRISVGEFITVIGLAQFLIEPFGLLAIVPSWIAEARASANRIALVVDAEALLPEGTATPSAEVATDLELCGVGYGSLERFDLRVRPGECVAVVAMNATDADALVTLLAGQVAPGEFSGTIRLAGVDLHDLDPDHARRRLLVEPHHADLFTGTLRANLTVHGDELGEPDEVVLRASAADEVVGAHPDGLDHRVAERGASLSGGQRQRLALARALTRRPPILVLHDPTTAVDTVTEHVIAQGIRDLRHGPGSQLSTVLLTTSPALLAVTDRVVVVSAGTVTAEGAHAELGGSDEDYRKLVLR